MEPSQDGIGVVRAHTDASLGAKRATTDDAADRAAVRSQRVLDDLILSSSAAPGGQDRNLERRDQIGLTVFHLRAGIKVVEAFGIDKRRRGPIFLLHGQPSTKGKSLCRGWCADGPGWVRAPTVARAKLRRSGSGVT